MSAKIKLNAASGGGSFSIQAPSSSSNNRVFTLPDSADAALLTATAALGKLGQIVTDIFETSSDISSSSSSYQDTGLDVTISASAAGSKIILIAFCNGSRVTNSGTNCVLNIQRNVSGGSSDDLSGQNMGLAHTYSNLCVSQSLGFVDTQDNFGSAVTYKVRYKNSGNSSYNAVPIRANTTSFMLAAEILA